MSKSCATINITFPGLSRLINSSLGQAFFKEFLEKFKNDIKTVVEKYGSVSIYPTFHGNYRLVWKIAVKQLTHNFQKLTSSEALLSCKVFYVFLVWFFWLQTFGMEATIFLVALLHKAVEMICFAIKIVFPLASCDEKWRKVFQC